MDLALARIRDNIGQLRGPVQRSAQDAPRSKIGWRVRVAHLRYYFGAALLAALAGIAVNALLLQHERHPAPLFGFAAPKLPAAVPTPASGPAAAPAAAQKPVSAEDNAASPRASAALPPTRPAEPAGSSPSAPDPIAELLAGEGHSDGARLILTAQTALGKLGYPVKPDGKEGAATEQALRDFERAHGLPPATEITERLVKQLTAAARASGH